VALALVAVAREEVGVAVVPVFMLWAGGRGCTSFSGSLGMAVVAMRWCSTAILCGCRGGLCVHWDGCDS